jgi:hypothetical protein
MRPGDVWHRVDADFLMPSRLGTYRSTLEVALAAGYEIVSVHRFWKLAMADEIGPGSRYLVLRHDIDTDPQTGAAMWSIDGALGVRGSYYFRLSTLDVRLMRAIHEGGAEASYHYEELASLAKERRIRRGEEALRSLPEAQDRFRRNVERLRTVTGLPIASVASHGDFVNRRLRVPNWAILVDRGFRERLAIDVETYDDSLMRHVTSRHSDAGDLGAWVPDEPLAAIERGSPVVYLLVHPRQWNVNRRSNFLDDARRLREGARYSYFSSPIPRADLALRTPAERAAVATLITPPPPSPSPTDAGPTVLPMRQPACMLVTAPDTYDAERRYILDVVLGEWFGLEYELTFAERSSVSIRLAGDATGRELVLPDVLFATPRTDWLSEGSLPRTPLRRVSALGDRGRGAPGVHGRDPDEIRFEAMPVLLGIDDLGDPVCGIDVFGSIFLLLTRYEEIARPVRDDHDRYPGYASLAAVEGFHRRPLADDYADVLWRAIRGLWPGLERRRFAFDLQLTHDVDQPWAALGLPLRGVWRSLLGDLFRRHDPILAALRTRALVAARGGRVRHDPFDTFDLLMEVSESRGLRSTFYFQAAGRDRSFAPTYDVADPSIRRLMQRIRARGHEVGLHGSYGSYRSTDLLGRELAALKDACRAAGIEQDTWGIRQHYLRFENPWTWRAQEAAGLAYDSTLGYADTIGFRPGTCREFPVFDLLARRALNLRERPLMIMDVTMFGYLGLGRAEAIEQATALVRACRDRGGKGVVCYHNSSLARRRDRVTYRELIANLPRRGT